MYEFNYQAPSNLADASKAIAAAEDGKLLAGGMTLVPTLKQRLARPSDLIDLGKIADLKTIKVDGSTVTIGAMCTHAAVGADAGVNKAIPGLGWLAANIGDPAVRHRGTLGGSISNNDPAADYPAALLALGATVYTTKRQLSAADFFVGMFETALELDEIVTAVSFPVPEKSGYQKFRNPASRYAVVGVFVAKTSAGVRVAVTGAGPSVFRVPAFEAALDKSFTPSALDGLTIDAGDLNADIHASADYRAHLVAVFAKRAIAAIG